MIKFFLRFSYTNDLLFDICFVLYAENDRSAFIDVISASLSKTTLQEKTIRTRKTDQKSKIYHKNWKLAFF